MNTSHDSCDNPRCICCRGYNAVTEYEKANGIYVETIELDYNEILAIKEETGSWLIAQYEAARRKFEREGNTEKEQYYMKLIKHYEEKSI